MNDDPSRSRSYSQRLRLLNQHHQALLELARARNQADDLDESLHRITETSARTLEVARVSIWIFDEERTKIICKDLFLSAENRHTDGEELFARDYPTYFRTLEQNRTLSADNCLEDERTLELAETYLKLHGVTSMLDAPIRQGGIIVGIVCHEHIGDARVWSIEDQNFAGSIADVCALTLERNERQRAEEEIRRRDALLEGVAKAANRMLSDTEREIGSRDAKLASLADMGNRLLRFDHSVDEIDPLLEIIGVALEASRVSLFAEHPHLYTGLTVTSERGRWAPDSSGSALELDVPWEERGLERWRSEFLRGRPIASTVKSLPPNERPAFEIRFGRAVLGIPIVVSNGLWGYLEVVDQTVEREWTDAEISFAVAATQMLGITLVA